MNRLGLSLITGCGTRRAASRWALIALLALVWPPAAPLAETADSVYTHREPSRDGTGRVYMGREISRVMGHRAANWLERSSRESEEAPDLLVSRLGLAPGDVVADIGSGTGYFTFRLSPLVPDGQVLAVDIQPEMLELLEQRMARERVDNVVPVLGTITNPMLPDGAVDLVLLVDSYHEFSHPHEMMTAVHAALRPGGRVVLVEYRAEDPDVPIKPLHKMTEAQAIREMEAVGLRWVQTESYLPRQHVITFEKPTE